MNTSISGLGSIGSIGDISQLQSGGQSALGDQGFSGVLKNALNQVNVLNDGAEQQIGTLLQGGNADLSSVMVAVEKADVAFQLMMQVRNKIVNAYQDIEKMQF